MGLHVTVVTLSVRVFASSQLLWAKKGVAALFRHLPEIQVLPMLRNPASRVL